MWDCSAQKLVITQFALELKNERNYSIQHQLGIRLNDINFLSCTFQAPVFML